jgi:hypothetical protein
MEHYEDRVADADIYINYHTKEIKFENKVMKSHPIIGMVKLFLIICGAFALMGAQMYFTRTYPYTIYSSSTGEPIIYETAWDYCKPIFLPMFGVTILAISLITIMEMLESGSIPWLRDRMLDSKRKGSHKLIAIPNPSSTILYQFVGSASPLIDMEYNNDIADALVDSSLVKKTEEKKLFNRIKYTRDYMVLNITFSRPTKGILRIIEY